MAFEEVKVYEICVLPKERALTFADHLNALGIEAYASSDFSEHWVVYTTHPKDVSRAKQELIKWAQSPFDSRFGAASWEKGVRVSKNKQLRGWMLGTINLDPFSLTSFIEIVCVLFFIGQLINEPWMLETFSLTRMQSFVWPWDFYRLLSPVFLHFGIMHIAFNLVMWEAMARPVERYLGRTKLFSIFISVSLISDVLQFAFMPYNGVFGGLSGAVYGVIAYLGMVSHRDDCPTGFYFPKGLIAVSVIFIAFGFFTSGTANMCHIGGLFLGLVWGLVDLKRAKLFA